MASETSVTGLAELQKRLDKLPTNLERNVMRGAMRAGVRVFLLKASSKIHDVLGELKDSLRVKTSSRNGVVSATLVAGGKKGWYAYMVEFGTTQHFIRPKHAKSLFIAGLNKTVVDHPGAKPKPFMRPALDEGQTEAFEATADYIRRRLEKEAART